MDSQEYREILSIFKAECDEHLQNLVAGMLSLERSPGSAETVEHLFRAAHSLKGASRMVGMEDIEKVAHLLEDLLGDFRKGRVYPSPEVIDGLSGFLVRLQTEIAARLTGTVASLDVAAYGEEIIAVREGRGRSATRGPKSVPPAGGSADEAPQAPSTGPDAAVEAGAVAAAEEDRRPAEAAAAPPHGEEQPRPAPMVLSETIRVETRKLDDLMNRIGEILIARIKSDQRAADISGLVLGDEALGRLVAQLKRMRPAINHAGGDAVVTGRLIDLIERIAESQEGIAKRLDLLFHDANEDNLRLTLLAAELQDSINRIRMLPISTVFNLLPRLLRDMSRELGKEVQLLTDGAWIQMDKRILEGLKDPLVHLVRNCVDHGIEVPAERSAAGKDPVGRVSLKAYQKGGNVFLEIEDDGRGIDLEKIRRVAVRRKIIPAGSEGEVPDTQLMQLIFHPGFSTKEIITDISGRGVGLDVVLSNIEALKGSITVRSRAGLGTRFTIKLPLTLATTQALLVATAGETLAIPVTAVEVTKVISPDEVTAIEGREAILLDGRPILLADLAKVLGYGESPVRRREIPVVVLSSTDDEVAFAVDQLIGEQEVIIKPLGDQLRKVINFSGATLLGDGRVSLIINVFDLVKSARRLAGTSVAPKKVDAVEARTKSIMVVDDSITTRTMERNILQAAGYRVITASDGLDALTRLEKEPMDLLVADVEMPRMDGFELTASVKKSERLRQMPVILVTSLDSDEDRRRGIELGADAYITKKTFDHGDLIRVVEQLI